MKTVLLIGSAGGLHRLSLDGSRQDETLPAPVNCLAVHPDEPTPLYAATDLGVFTRHNTGWTLGVSCDALTVAVDPDDPGCAFAGTLHGEIMRTDDAGRHWLLTGTFGGAVRAFSLHPAAPSTVYAAIEGSGICLGRHRGATWIRCAAPLWVDCVDLVHHPRRPETIYAATDLGVYRTTDGGARWEPLLDAPAYLLGISLDGELCAILPLKGASILVQMRRGRTAERLLPAVPSDFAVHPELPECMGLVSSRGEVWWSSDGGRSWQQLAGGLPPLRHLLIYDLLA